MDRDNIIKKYLDLNEAKLDVKSAGEIGRKIDSHLTNQFNTLKNGLVKTIDDIVRDFVVFLDDNDYYRRDFKLDVKTSIQNQIELELIPLNFKTQEEIDAWDALVDKTFSKSNFTKYPNVMYFDISYAKVNSKGVSSVSVRLNLAPKGSESLASTWFENEKLSVSMR